LFDLFMEKEYTKEEWWKLYEQLPPALQEAIFSQENAKIFAQICQRHNIADKSQAIAKYIGRVMLGLLPVEDFRIKLEEVLNFEEKLSKEVFHDINRFIFLPVKAELNKIYYGIQPPPPQAKKEERESEEVEIKPPELISEQPEKPEPKAPEVSEKPIRQTDQYREPIE